MSPKSFSSQGVAALEDWLDTRADALAVSWSLDEADLWPLFKATLNSLAILTHVGQPKAFTAVGRWPWRAIVRADHIVLSRARQWMPRRLKPELPSDGLRDRIVLHASAIQCRDIEGFLVCAPLDVAAIALSRRGGQTVTWIDDLGPHDPRLINALTRPLRGLAHVLADARRSSGRSGTTKRLVALPGFDEWCATAARHLGLSPSFLRLWLARQVNLMLSAAKAYGEIFDANGRPKAVVMLSGGFWATAGLTLAARRRGIRVVEIQHGAEGKGTVTAPLQTPNFSTFNSAPDGFVSWETEPRRNPDVFSAGPIGLHLPALLADGHESDPAEYSRLATGFARQRSALAKRAAAGHASREILVSMQHDDDAKWIADIADHLPQGFFLWCRRHGADRDRPLPSWPSLGPGRADFELATGSLLPLLLERSAVHLTRFSAVTLEAAACGIPTVAIEPLAHSLYCSVVPQALLTVQENAEQAADALANGPKRKAASSLAGGLETSRLADFLVGR